MAYAKVRTDNMSGTTLGKDLFSIKYESSAGTAAAIENGNVVLVGDLISGQRNVRLASPVAVDTPLGMVALVASEEVTKEVKYDGIKDFRNEAGDIARAYRLVPGDIFAVTSSALTIEASYTLGVGGLVELAAGTKLYVAKSTTGHTEGSTKVGKVIAMEGEWVVIEVGFEPGTIIIKNYYDSEGQPTEPPGENG